jgi:putative glutathione S-transferase
MLARGAIFDMGLLVEGEWRDQWYDTRSTDGEFVREDSAFRNRVTPSAIGPSIQPASFRSVPN